jgi:hypothetical protein
MKVRKSGSWVLWYEAIGFLLIIALSWVNEIEGLPEVLFGGKAHVRDWRDTAAQTLVIIYVWAIVFGLTKKLVDRLHHLEGLLKVCAWCRRVGHNGKWLKMERYFAEGFHIQTTHGMCPDCLKKIQHDTAEFKRKEGEASSSSASDGQTSLAS